MGRLLLLCAGERDLRELCAAGLDREHEIIRHDYATEALEQLIVGAPSPSNCESIRDPLVEIRDIVAELRSAKIDGVVSTDDYPGSTLAAIVARAFGLPGVDPAVDLSCQHKYVSRQLQSRHAPDAVPRFTRIDAGVDDRTLEALRYPAFAKPVKSFFSIGARRVESAGELRRAARDNPASAAFLAPFAALLAHETGREVGPPTLVEDWLSGLQATLDGYVHGGVVHVLGIVDSILFPGTTVFERFEYPSALPAAVQRAISEVARNVMAGIGFDNGLFNIEFIHDPDTGVFRIVEINPRMSSQFADLYRKVDGFSPYRVMVDLALGRRPLVRRRAGRFAVAASCVLRTFEDQLVLRTPLSADIARVQLRHPDVVVEILATEGARLSSAMQDGFSFRYGLIDIGGDDRGRIRQAFDDCRKRLPFVMQPVDPSADRCAVTAAD